MYRIIQKSAWILALTTVVSSSAWAHRNWLLPSNTQVEGAEPWVTFDVAVSENLFDLDTNAIKLDGLKITGPDGNAVTAENPFTGRLRSSFDLKLSKSGTYRVGIVSESLMASYKVGTETKRFRGTAEAFAKEVPVDAQDVHISRTLTRLDTFVTSGKGNDTALKPAGEGLELIPLTHPSEFAVGQSSSFRLLLDGKPLFNLEVSVVPGGVKYRGVLKEQTATTDDKGEFKLTWPNAGMYWINASYPPRVAPPAGMNNAPQGAAPAGMPERRLTYSGTFEVLP